MQAIRIGESTWTVGETVRKVGSNVFKRPILEPVFGARWKSALIEGRFAGHGGTRKYRVEWTSFNPPLVEEYGAQPYLCYLLIFFLRDTSEDKH